MNILMMTNTFTPFVGGVSRSVTAFARQCRQAGHRVVIVAPQFEGAPTSEEDVIRIPAIQHFNGSDFAVALPVPGYLSSRLEDFKPDIVHSHHPHLLGNTAVRIASRLSCPLVFTHHTMYEHYLHYVPAEAHRMRQFVITLVTGYCNLCDCVITPSESVAAILRDRAVETPLAVIPTGVDVQRFGHGNGRSFRRSHGIPQRASVAGYVGRLAPEKNLTFLAEAMCDWIAQTENGHFLVVGSGPSDEEIRQRFEQQACSDRLHLAGALDGPDLVDAYHAMDVFVFVSCSETQGMVLTEAMAAGKPVVALDAPGVREVVKDGYNGRLLMEPSAADFADAVVEVASASTPRRERFRQAARETAEQFSIQRCATRLVRVYERLLKQQPCGPKDESVWHQAAEEIKAEWELLKNMAEAVGHAMTRQ
ncbi:MAG: glycosyl transferase family 1 [Planctomycetes bacterium RBG_13_62_9]|nr:MAG: glycosyl transferase family 1 [Planctomycetes bacterium RBG_13_62_9]